MRARRPRAMLLAVLAAVTAAAAPPAIAQEPQRGRAPDAPGFPAPQAEPRAQQRQTPPNPTGWETDPAVAERVAGLLAQLTVEEKVDLATGRLNNFYGFFNNPIERLGIPPLTMADGPVGVRIANPDVFEQRATEMPSATSLAATWSPARAADYGDLLSGEAFASGHNTLLAPSVDIARTPLWGRAFEGFGEDPLLAGRMGAAYIGAVQQRPVMATVKHFAVYNQETARFTVTAQVGERALREIYFRPFEIAVRDGVPGAAMCSFNAINGRFACEHPAMTRVLKQDFGFGGFVMSDYNSTPSTAPAANAGLDQEHPGDQGPGTANFGERLLAAVAAGQVSQARLDDMAARILRPMVGLGLFDSPPTITPFDVAANGQRSRVAAREGMVLLKNEDAALPFAGDRTPRSIAVIGPDADNASARGGGSARVKPTYEISPLEGLTNRAEAAGASVEYAPGADGVTEGDLLPGPPPVPSSLLSPPDGGGRGLSAQYWPNASFSGEPLIRRVDPNVNLNFGFVTFPGFNAGSPKHPSSSTSRPFTGAMSARWDGTITAPQTGDYVLTLTARGDASLDLDGQRFLTHAGALSTVRRAIRLEADVPHTVHIDYSAQGLGSYTGGQVRFGWRHAEEVVSPQVAEAVALARRSEAAVVVVRDYESESQDRPSLDLPKEQDQLLRRVAAVNPRTVAVVMTGAPTQTSTWEADVPAIVQAWYPGQEQGNALADVLFGDVDASGRLPVTFPRNERATPVSRPEQFPGIGACGLGEQEGGSGGVPDAAGRLHPPTPGHEPHHDDPDDGPHGHWPPKPHPPKPHPPQEPAPPTPPAPQPTPTPTPAPEPAPAPPAPDPEPAPPAPEPVPEQPGGSGPPANRAPVIDCVADFSEGVFVGYRGHDQFDIAPQYPFGHGLSYTTFAYDDLRIGAGRRQDGGVPVTFTVRNTGSRPGVEVPQVYVGRLPAPVATPPRQLAGFDRIELQPGEQRTVTVTVARRSLSYWDRRANRWRLADGPVPIHVGRSSRDLQLEGRVGLG